MPNEATLRLCLIQPDVPISSIGANHLTSLRLGCRGNPSTSEYRHFETKLATCSSLHSSSSPSQCTDGFNGGQDDRSTPSFSPLWQSSPLPMQDSESGTFGRLSGISGWAGTASVLSDKSSNNYENKAILCFMIFPVHRLILTMLSWGLPECSPLKRNHGRSRCTATASNSTMVNLCRSQAKA